MMLSRRALQAGPGLLCRRLSTRLRMPGSGGHGAADPNISKAIWFLTLGTLGLPLAAAYMYDPVPGPRKAHKVKMRLWGTSFASKIAEHGLVSAQDGEQEGVRAVLVQSGARHVCARVVGDPAAPMVIVMHGIAGSRAELDALLATSAQSGGLAAAAEAAGVCIVAMDRPGYGLTSPAADGQSALDTAAADAASMLRALEGSSCSVVGTSFGAVPALAFAAQHPHLVSGSVHLLSPDWSRVGNSSWLRDAFMWTGPLARVAVDAFARFVRMTSVSLGAEALKSAQLAGLKTNAADAAALEHVPGEALLMNTTTSLDAGQQGLAADLLLQMGAASDLAELASHVHTPVSLTRGADDHIVPDEVLEALHSALPSSTLRVLDGQGHLSAVQRALPGALQEAAAAAAERRL